MPLYRHLNGVYDSRAGGSMLHAAPPLAGSVQKIPHPVRVRMRDSDFYTIGIWGRGRLFHRYQVIFLRDQFLHHLANQFDKCGG